MLEYTLNELRKIGCETCGNIWDFIVESPYLLETGTSIAFEMCIANLFIQMTESEKPQEIMQIFVDYIFALFEDNNILTKFSIAMAGLRGNYIVSYLQNKVDLDTYMKCYRLMGEKGKDLLNTVDLEF